MGDRDRQFGIRVVGDVRGARDCAKRLMAEFDLQVQSEHCGDLCTLSMEGCAARIQSLLKWHSK